MNLYRILSLTKPLDYSALSRSSEERSGKRECNGLPMCEQQQTAALTSASLVWDTISLAKISHGVLGGGAYFRIYQVYLRCTPGTSAAGTPDVKREPEWPFHGVACFELTPFGDPSIGSFANTCWRCVILLASVELLWANFFSFFSFFFFFFFFFETRSERCWVVFLDLFSRKLFDTWLINLGLSVIQLGSSTWIIDDRGYLENWKFEHASKNGKNMYVGRIHG